MGHYESGSLSLCVKSLRTLEERGAEKKEGTEILEYFN